MKNVQTSFFKNDSLSNCFGFFMKRPRLNHYMMDNDRFISYG